jgi:cobalamin biosynthetic protein CobC
MLEHGGKLRWAAKRYGIPLAQWLDLSTGINPVTWPVPPQPAAIWNRLPEDDDDLVEVARAYYSARSVLPVAGSQAAIMALPGLLCPGPGKRRIGILSPSYAEHAYAWQQAGHELVPLSPENIEATLPGLDGLVLVSPNNPTGHIFSKTTLLQWHENLAARGGFLLIDEAFMDATPEHSLADHSHLSNLVVLRSLGKFFGLAGARVGFVLAHHDLLEKLQEILGPWTVSGPSRYVAKAALADVDWHHENRAYLEMCGERLQGLLSHYGLAPVGGTALFQWLRHDDAIQVHDWFARQGIWLRLFEEPSSLRFGLPGTEEGWQRLEAALQDLQETFAPKEVGEAVL